MKSIRSAVTIIIIFKLFGIVAGINWLPLIALYILSLIGSAIATTYKIAVEINNNSNIIEENE